MIIWTFNVSVLNYREEGIEYHVEDVELAFEGKENPYITVTKWV